MIGMRRSKESSRWSEKTELQPRGTLTILTKTSHNPLEILGQNHFPNGGDGSRDLTCKFLWFGC